MRIIVKVKPGAKQEKVERVSEQELTVWVREPAKENKANHAVLRVLAEYFKVRLSQVALLSGRTTRQKIIEIRE